MKNKIMVCLAAAMLSFNASSQELAKAKADKNYQKFAYVDAIKTYEQIAAKGYKSADMFAKLGDSYYFNANLDKAAYWYEQMFAINKKPDAEYYYRYAQSLKTTGKYEKSDQLMNEFIKKVGKDTRAEKFANASNYLAVIKANSGRYTIADAGINSPASDYGASMLDNKLVFASAREDGLLAKKHAWTGAAFTNLYSVSLGSTTGTPEKLSKGVNTRFDEASPVFTSDGQTMYFTRTNFNDGKKGQSSGKEILLKVYRATLTNGEWGNVTELPFNSDNYSVAHPALSSDGKTLYFASDMPGTKGMSDIFKVAINGDGTFGKPVNLGPMINTEARETFPSITDQNELYFASDGHPGLGGLDIFASEIAADGSINAPINIGAPANSPHDDFAFLLDTKTRSGFLSSNRPGGKGLDDVYQFQEIKKLRCEQLLSGLITEVGTSEIIADAALSLYDKQFSKIGDTKSDASGIYQFTVNCGDTYYVRAEKPTFSTSEKTIAIAEKTGQTTLPLQLEQKLAKVTVGTDLAKVLDIKTIYFDRGKYDIRTDAAQELEKILAVLKENPTMKIDVRAHTDSRQTHQFNDVLSNNRAKSSINWLAANGIEASRLTGKGYGETQLLNKCSDGVECTEDEHQQNRRSEFIITEL